MYVHAVVHGLFSGFEVAKLHNVIHVHVHVLYMYLYTLIYMYCIHVHVYTCT